MKIARPRHFILSGSANILTLPKLSESLAGRMEVHTLWPLSQREIHNHPGSFIDDIFKKDYAGADSDLSEGDIVDCILKGGYPEALLQMNAGRGPEWFNSYLMTILQRDIRELSNIEGLTDMPNLLGLIASRAGKSATSFFTLSGDVDIRRCLPQNIGQFHL
jgi:uncharacterized protein